MEARRWTSWRLARLFGVREQRILAIIAIKELEARAGFTEDTGDDADEGALGNSPPGILVLNLTQPFSRHCFSSGFYRNHSCRV